MALGFTMASFLAAILTSILTARLLGPEGRGEYAIIFLWATTLASAATLSVGDAMGTIAARIDVDSDAIDSIARRAIPTGAAAVLMTLVPCLIAFHFAVATSGIEMTPFLHLLAAIVIVAGAVNPLAQNYHRAKGRHLLFNVARSSVIMLSVSLAALWIVAPSVKLSSVLIVVIAAQIGAALISASSFFGLLSSIRAWKPDMELLLSGAAMHAPMLLFIVTSQIDRFVAMYAFPAAEFGFYAVAASVAQPASSLIWMTLRSVMIGDRALQDPSSRRARVRQYAGWLMLATLFASPAVVIAIHPIIPMAFGASFQPAVEMSAWLVLGYALTPLRVMFVETARITQRSGHAVVVECVYLTAVLALALVATNYHLSVATLAQCMVVGNVVAVAVAVGLRRFEGAQA